MKEIDQIIEHWLELLMKLVDIKCDPHLVEAYLSGIGTKKLIHYISDFVSNVVTVILYVNVAKQLK